MFFFPSISWLGYNFVCATNNNGQSLPAGSHPNNTQDVRLGRLKITLMITSPRVAMSNVPNVCRSSHVLPLMCIFMAEVENICFECNLNPRKWHAKRIRTETLKDEWITNEEREDSGMVRNVTSKDIVTFFKNYFYRYQMSFKVPKPISDS